MLRQQSARVDNKWAMEQGQIRKKRVRRTILVITWEYICTTIHPDHEEFLLYAEYGTRYAPAYTPANRYFGVWNWRELTIGSTKQELSIVQTDAINYIMLGEFNAHVSKLPCGIPSNQSIAKHAGCLPLLTVYRFSGCKHSPSSCGRSLDRFYLNHGYTVLKRRCRGDLLGTPTFET